MSVDAILVEIEALSPADRAELLTRLSERFPPEDGSSLSPELRALLDQREAEADANPDAGYTWDEVVAYVKRKK